MIEVSGEIGRDESANSDLQDWTTNKVAVAVFSFHSGREEFILMLLGASPRDKHSSVVIW